MNLGATDVARRKFAVTRKGYDPDEVARYLQHVAAIITELEAAADEATARAERREAQLLSLQAASDDGMHRALAAGDVPVGDRVPIAPGEAARETERIIAAAADHAARLRDQAEVALARALATTEMIEADQERLLAAAKEERDTMLAAARTEAAAIIAEARMSAAATREDAQRFAEDLRELTATETIELVSYAKAMAAAILDRAGSEEIGIALEGEDLTIELTESEPAGQSDAADPAEQDVGLGGTRPSRYESQSAHLPVNDDASSTIDSVESLRDQS